MMSSTVHKYDVLPLKLRCEILLYLDKKGMLEQVREDMYKYEKVLMKRSKEFPPFHNYINIDILDLYKESGELGDSIIREPQKWQIMLRDVLHACLKANARDKTLCTLQPKQIYTSIRLRGTTSSINSSGNRCYNGLSTFKGLLLQMSKPYSCSLHSVWLCPEKCNGTELVLNTFPLVAPRCTKCRSVLRKADKLGRCGEQVSATFKEDNGRLWNVVMADHLIPELHPASHYTVIINTHKQKHGSTMYAWGLEKMPLRTVSRMTVPQGMEHLLERHRNDPWTLVYALATLVGKHICPTHTFMHLKMGLIISLASLGSVQRHTSHGGPCHILTAGADTGYVCALLRDAAQLANSHTLVGLAHHSVADSLVASASGLCVMALPWNTYRSKFKHGMLLAMESGEIRVNEMRVPLESCVWAQAADNASDIASIFGTVHRGDFYEWTDDLATHILGQSISATTPKSRNPTRDQLKEYLSLVQDIQVDLDCEAEKLLRRYFLAARKDKPGSVGLRSLPALARMAAAAARITGHGYVTSSHAELSIWLHVVGGPFPRAAPDNVLDVPTCVEHVGETRVEFCQWLEQYIDRVSTDTRISYSGQIKKIQQL